MELNAWLVMGGDIKFKIMNITITKGDLVLDYKDFIFPGGEVGVKLNSQNYKFLYDSRDITIFARLQNSNDVIKLSMIKDAVQRFDKNKKINLIMPYIPYGRQDRVCDKGESFSLKVFCDFINNLTFNKVTIIDPHSEVSCALINNSEIITQFDIINKWLDFTNKNKMNILVAPDAGANKKTSEIAKYFQQDSFIRADKLRDLSTGNIKETIVYYDDFKGGNVLCVDDICDGGRTFVELAKVCKAKNCGKFILYVTHGIFSKGLDELLNNGIDEIWTTNSFRNDLTPTDKLHILDLGKLLNYE